jgi:hypothetical protein
MSDSLLGVIPDKGALIDVTANMSLRGDSVRGFGCARHSPAAWGKWTGDTPARRTFAAA